MRPLTAKMRDVLRRIADGAKASYYPYMGRFNEHPYYCIAMDGYYGRCTREINGLIARGLLEQFDFNDRHVWYTHQIRITVAGMAEAAKSATKKQRQKKRRR